METKTKTQSQTIVGPSSALAVPFSREVLKAKLRQISVNGTLFSVSGVKT
jgi:hypothetical protein